MQASYNSDAVAALVSKPQDRVPGVRAMAEKLGGKLESFDFSLGEHDVIALATLPDDTAAAAFALAVNAAGHLKSYKTTRLISGEDFVAAQQKAHGLNYQATASGGGVQRVMAIHPRHLGRTILKPNPRARSD